MWSKEKIIKPKKKTISGETSGGINPHARPDPSARVEIHDGITTKANATRHANDLNVLNRERNNIPILCEHP